MSRETELRAAVLRAVREYCAHRFAPSPFVPGETYIPAAGKVFDEREVASLVDCSLDFWLTAGRFAERFESALAERLGLRHVLMTNSGSSAGLLAVSALTAPELGDRRLRPGDEVVTAAAGFPTTINPILQCGAVPVFVDVELPGYNATLDRIEAALSPKTKAIVLAHTLGNPFAAGPIAGLARRKGLWLVEDCCDALGALYGGKPVSTFGDAATFSFYPAHHITTGEGGAVGVRDGKLKRLIESFRDWGRDCWCATGKDDTCGKRFGWKLGELPRGYDHKYVYSHLGYNLKATEMQAAVGVAQLDRLDEFIAVRRRNFDLLREGLRSYEERLILPRATPGSEPSWFGFPITLREGAAFQRDELTAFLEERKVGTRLLFAGNVTRQPYFKGVAHRKVGDLAVSDRVMRDSFWIGVFPGITPEMVAYILGQFEAFFKIR